MLLIPYIDTEVWRCWRSWWNWIHYDRIWTLLEGSTLLSWFLVFPWNCYLFYRLSFFTFIFDNCLRFIGLVIVLLPLKLNYYWAGLQLLLFLDGLQGDSKKLPWNVSVAFIMTWKTVVVAFRRVSFRSTFYCLNIFLYNISDHNPVGIEYFIFFFVE